MKIVVLVLAILIWNIIVFIMMGADKRKAEKGKWRISEKTLLLAAFMLGAPGAIIGSRLFHHKTLKTKFKIGLPIALIFNAVELVLILDLIVVFSAMLNMENQPDHELYKNPEIYGTDCIIVLGCGIDDAETPSEMLRDRLDRGIELYQKGCAPKILMSGDNGRYDHNEIHVMVKYALDAGVPAEDIFCDHAGFSTYDSMYRLQSIFGAESAVVVTQRFHEYRAVYIGKQLGMHIVGVPSVNRKYVGDAYWEAREILARCKDFVKVAIKPGSELGGDPISLKGDSLLSWEQSEIDALKNRQQ